MIKITENYSARVNPIIGREYCNLLSKIKDRKSTVIEFILFLLCLGSEKIILNVAEDEEVHKILSEKRFIKKL